MVGDRNVNLILEVAAEGVELHMDVLEIGEDEWAVHGRLAYEGEVIAATFASKEEAWTALTAAAAGEDRIHPEGPNRASSHGTK